MYSFLLFDNQSFLYTEGTIIIIIIFSYENNKIILMCSRLQSVWFDIGIMSFEEGIVVF